MGSCALRRHRMDGVLHSIRYTGLTENVAFARRRFMSLRGATDYVQGINRITRCRATNYKTPLTLRAEATITHPHQANELSLASMSEPIILTLTSWTQTRIQNLFAATTQAQFQEAYDAFFAQDVQLTVNNRTISRSDFENELWQTASTKTSASVQFLGTVEIPTDSSNPLEVRILRYICSNRNIADPTLPGSGWSSRHVPQGHP